MVNPIQGTLNLKPRIPTQACLGCTHPFLGCLDPELHPAATHTIACSYDASLQSYIEPELHLQVLIRIY